MTDFWCRLGVHGWKNWADPQEVIIVANDVKDGIIVGQFPEQTKFIQRRSCYNCGLAQQRFVTNVNSK
jgi:hypothetical protein